MNFLVTIDWKFVAALGAAVSGIILVSKMDSDAAERVSTYAVDVGLSFVNLIFFTYAVFPLNALNNIYLFILESPVLPNVNLTV